MTYCFLSLVYSSVGVLMVIASATKTGISGYGAGAHDICWIGSWHLRLGTYLIPQVFIMIISVIISCITIGTIYKRSSANRQAMSGAHGEGNSTRSLCEQVMKIAVKLCVLIGGIEI